jgi:2-polyprenyl-3-methyl-5-hydroxy-6-metoxy-1,4-benzoquinol methylase
MEINKKLAELQKTIETQNAQIKDLMAKLNQGGHVSPKQLEDMADVLSIDISPALNTDDPVFNELLKLLNSANWPPAVDPNLICDVKSEQDKEDRAEGILDLIIDIHLEGLKFLDFGCGEGHVVNKSRQQKSKLSVGYDIIPSDKWNSWEKTNNVIYTTDWNIVKSSGPYNVLLMYDVIDHMIMPKADLITQLKNIKELIAPNAKVYVRNHPWCSRHGTHLYHKLNKAFAHIVFTKKEIEHMGFTQDEVRMIKHPIQEYEELFKAAGFRITNGPHIIKDKIDPFFNSTPVVSQRIKSHYTASFEIAKKEIIPPLEIQFVDYILG